MLLALVTKTSMLGTYEALRMLLTDDVPNCTLRDDLSSLGPALRFSKNVQLDVLIYAPGDSIASLDTKKSCSHRCFAYAFNKVDWLLIELLEEMWWPLLQVMTIYGWLLFLRNGVSIVVVRFRSSSVHAAFSKT